MENILQKYLIYFFVLIFIITVHESFIGYIEHHSWNVGDWLINYQGGFIRRGLLGEVIYQLSYYTSINLGLFVFILQIFFYGVFFFYSYKLLKKQDSLLPYAFLIFSPFIFTFQINNPEGGYRKEIIYFALFAFLTWSAFIKKPDNFEKIFYIILLIYPFIILTHEMLAIFLPYFLVIYVLSTTLNRKKIIIVSTLLSFSFVSFFVSIYYHGSTSQIVEIFKSTSKGNYVIEGGAILWLNKGISYGFLQVVNKIKFEYYALYIILIFISLIAYIPLLNKLKYIVNNSLVIFFLSLSIIGSIPLFIVAIDWGRFIQIHLISIFFILLLPLKKVNDKFLLKINGFVICFFMMYILLWYIPYMGSPLSALTKNSDFLMELLIFFEKG